MYISLTYCAIPRKGDLDVQNITTSTRIIQINTILFLQSYSHKQLYTMSNEKDKPVGSKDSSQSRDSPTHQQV